MSRLKRDEMEFVHQKCDVVAIKEFPSFNLLGRRLGPFKLGHSITLDHYVARILVEQGIVKFEEQSHLNGKTIQKINFQESTNPELGKISEDFVYTQAHEHLEILNKLYEYGRAPRQEFKQLYSDLNDLIRVRLAKIIRLAIHVNPGQAKKVLTSEETILFNELSQKIKEWRESLGKLDSETRS